MAYNAGLGESDAYYDTHRRMPLSFPVCYEWPVVAGDRASSRRCSRSPACWCTRSTT